MESDWLVKLVVGAAVAFVVAALAILALAFVAIIGAIPVYFLWNWLMPDLFELPHLTFWQAWGIFWLASILFKSHAAKSSDKQSKRTEIKWGIF